MTLLVKLKRTERNKKMALRRVKKFRRFIIHLRSDVYHKSPSIRMIQITLKCFYFFWCTDVSWFFYVFLFIHHFIIISHSFTQPPTHSFVHVNIYSHTSISRSSTHPPSWLEEEEASIASSSYSKKQQPFPQQKPLQAAAPQQQPPTQSQSQHSPGSNELKLTAQQSTEDKSLFDNDGANMENETKSVSSMRSQDR